MIYIDVDTAVTVPVNVMPLTDDTDFKTRETGVAYNESGMDLVWNFCTPGGTITQTAVTPTTSGDYDWTHTGDGMYQIEIPASGGASINNATEGTGYFTGVCDGVLPWRGPDIVFRAAGLNDLLIEDAYSATRGLAGTALPAAAADAAGGLVISDAGGLDIDGVLSGNVPQTGDSYARIGADGAGLTALAGLIEAALVDDGDATAFLQAVADKIAGDLTTGDVTAQAIASATRDAILNRVLNGNHDTAGTTGKILQDGATASTQLAHSASLASIVSTLGTPAGADIATDIAAVKTDTASLLTRIPAALFSGITSLAGWLRWLARKDAALATDDATSGSEINADGGSGAGAYNNATDSQEALRDNQGGGSGLTQQQVADALKLAPTSGTPAAGSVNADLDTLLTRTAGSTLSIVSPVAEDGELTLYAGAEYSSTDGTALAFNFTDDNDPDLTGDSAILRILTVANWEAGTYDDPALELTDGVVTHDGSTTATATFEATEDETALLVVPGPPADCNYRYQVLTNTGTRLRVRASGACTVKPVIDASS